MTNTQNRVCPRCGKPKSASARLCLACHMAQTRHAFSKHPKEPCPRCGRPKLVASGLCRACRAGRSLPVKPYRPHKRADVRSPDWTRVSADFLLQFVGLVLAEGSVRCVISRGTTLACSLVIQLRSDDLPALEAIQERLGGTVRAEARRGHSPMVRWEVAKREDVRTILAAMRPLVRIPMRKAQEFDVLLEYYAWRDRVGYQHVDTPRVREFYERLRALKKYSEHEAGPAARPLRV